MRGPDEGAGVIGLAPGVDRCPPPWPPLGLLHLAVLPPGRSQGVLGPGGRPHRQEVPPGCHRGMDRNVWGLLSNW